MQTITKKIALQMLEEVVEERGEDFVYEAPLEQDMCVYMDDTSDERDPVPSCGVGLLLYKLNPDFTDAILEEGLNGAGMDQIAPRLRSMGEVQFTRSAVAVLLEFQLKQDFSTPYQAALAAARQSVADKGNAIYTHP